MPMYRVQGQVPPHEHRHPRDPRPHRRSQPATDPRGGTITLHPRGLSHGPRPGFLDQPKSDMLPLYAFMLDTRDHLTVTAAARTAMVADNLHNFHA
jgi:hypothetical protein